MSKRIKLNDLRPDPRNHNKHTASGMALLEKSVEQVGVIESITVSNDDQIISGNARHEVIGRKFDSEPIVIETDGTRPVILKRTDIQSNTPEFYKASILANTTAKKNIDIDIEVVEELAEDFNFKIEDLGIDIDQKDLEKEPDDIYSGNFPLSIVLLKSDFQKWQNYKKSYGFRSDTDAFLKLMDDNLVQA